MGKGWRERVFFSNEKARRGEERAGASAALWGRQQVFGSIQSADKFVQLLNFFPRCISSNLSSQ
jgi:hypothetical protein